MCVLLWWYHSVCVYYRINKCLTHNHVTRKQKNHKTPAASINSHWQGPHKGIVSRAAADAESWMILCLQASAAVAASWHSRRAVGTERTDGPLVGTVGPPRPHRVDGAAEGDAIGVPVLRMCIDSIKVQGCLGVKGGLQALAFWLAEKWRHGISGWWQSVMIVQSYPLCDSSFMFLCSDHSTVQVVGGHLV